jgi:hypothetical protein
MGRHLLLAGRRSIGTRLLVTCALVCGSVVGLAGLAPEAHSSASEVLILGSTVSGGTSSLEAQEVSAQGFTPVVVDDATWEGMTTAQFASYRAIVIGDPTCGSYDDTSHLTAALSNPGTWGAAVNGNVLIIGTDPVYHAGGTLSSGPGKLIAHGIDFALAQSGKTGAYIDLSCAYGEMPANTPVKLLDGLRSGGFTVDGTPSSVCYNDAHIVATHPALAGLTDADLSGWGCSVHESFDTWPGDYTVLAMARNFGSTFTASDGTVGEPYILASGTGLHSFPLSLDPLAQNASTGSAATVTATLLDGSTGLPVTGQAIAFRVESGPNAGTAGKCSVTSCSTDASGQVKWTFSGLHAGTDTVQAWIDKNGNGQPDLGESQTTAAVTWKVGGYIAMGDSYSSGEGAIDSSGNVAFDTGTATSTDKCHRSAPAYAYQLKAAMGVSDSNFKFVACSGAMLADFVAKVPLVGQWTEDQQLNAIAPAGKTNPGIGLVTLSVGGNDSGFPGIMAHCVIVRIVTTRNSEDGCRSFAESAAADGRTLLSNGGYIRIHPASDPKDVTWSFCTGACRTWARTLSFVTGDVFVNVPSLADLYQEIHNRAPNARIRVLLYPQLFPDHPPADCTVGTFTSIGHITYRFHLTRGEMAELNKLGASLNSTIAKQVAAAAKSGIDISTVPSTDGFSGHRICDSGTPWINGLMWNGFFSNAISILNSFSVYSFHPNALGQAEFGDLMKAKS